MRLIISEEEKKSILSLHSSYGYKAFINEQDLTPSRPEGPQDEPQGLEHGIGQIETVDVLSDKSTRYMLGVVKDKDGNPIPNVKITVTDKNGNNVFTHTTSAGTETKITRVVTTNDKGEFKILGLTTEDSPYTLMGELDGYTTINKKFRKGDEVVKMDLTMEKPKEPKVKEPKEPKVKEPKEPKVREPKEPKVREPKPVKPLSKRSMERLNNKVYRELVNELKKENLIFYVRESESDKEPLQLQIDKGKEFEVDYNPAVVTIPTLDPETKQPNGEIKFDCNMEPVILMRMGEESYKSRLKYNGEPYYEIKMPLEFGRDWIKINYCDRLVSRTDDGKIIAPYDKR
jgi:hypothetical protein